MTVTILKGDCREVLRELPAESVHCVVTSPPYFGLRDYGVAGQIGLEETPSAFVGEMVAMFSEVRRVLRDDGTLWLNLGDSYCPENRGENAKPRSFEGYAPQLQGGHFHADIPTRKAVIQGVHADIPTRKAVIQGVKADGIKRKDLMGIPWRVAFALQSDGWYLRQDIIWSKPNPMPESVRDRCTKAHEYLFLLSKNERYYYDADAISEPSLFAGDMKIQGEKSLSKGQANGANVAKSGNALRDRVLVKDTRNKRSVWDIPTSPYPEAHFATFPPALIEPCILAGCPKGGTVLDPFGGAGTTGMVADRNGRDSILIEINPEYAAMAERRIRGDAGMFAEVQS